MQDRIDSSKTKMNVGLMRRVAEVLMSYEPESFRTIDLDARGKAVILKGLVVGEEARKLALELARTTAGVEQVVDRLTVVGRRRPAPVAATLSAPEKKDPPLTRGLVLVALLGVISSSVVSLFRAPAAPGATAPAVVAGPEKSTVYPVEGTLFVEGRPAAGAKIVFHPVEEFNESTCRAAAVVGPDGRFSLKTLDDRRGAPAGKFAVTVSWYRPIPPGEEISPQEAGSLVPPRFQKPHTTPLRVSIRPKIAPDDRTAVVELPPLHVSHGPNVRRS